MTLVSRADRQRWNALKLDAVICPVASHDDYNDWTHTLPWNVLQYCALAMPVGKVEERDMELSEEYVREEPRKVDIFREGLKKVRGEMENRAMCAFHVALSCAFGPAALGALPVPAADPPRLTGLDDDLRRDSLGLPLSLQVVAPHWMDEQCLAVASVIDEVVKQ